MTDLTARLGARASGLGYADLTPAAATVARQCLLDWLGVTIAARHEPLVEILLADALEDGAAGRSTVVGRPERLGVVAAALVNGAMSHALDYDDVHYAIQGHPTVTLAPAVLAQGERMRASGRDVLVAFVAGFETGCRVGRFVGRSHYSRGWHATATVGSFAAAAAAARLLGLDAAATARALGIAGTQAAGLKSMFGTMCKPLHAGKAAENGLRAARWAARGYTANPEVLETPQGFGATQSDQTDAEAALATPEGGFFIVDTLFKYHAACYGTHSSIEVSRDLARRHGLRPDQVRAMRLLVTPEHLAMCNIPAPVTGLEAKFSLRLANAMALAGVDTARQESFTDEIARRPDLVALRDRIEVVAGERASRSSAGVELELTDGRRLQGETDVGVPLRDQDEQWRRLKEKFRGLVVPVLGGAAAERLIGLCEGLEEIADIGDLLRATVPARPMEKAG